MNEIARRDTLQLVAGLVSATAVGTAAGRLRSAPATGSAPGALDAVPATADAVVSANVDVLRQDDGMRALTTAALQQRVQYQSGNGSAESPRSVDALLADAEATFQKDPETVHRATAFGDIGGEGEARFGDYGGVVLRADLSAEALKNGIENLDDIAFTELEASGTVVYEPESDGGPWVGALGSDRVVVGTEAAVSDAIAVENGETTAVDEPLRGAYTDTRDAPARFVTHLPDPSDNDAVPERIGDGGSQSVDLTPLDHVTTLAGAVYRDGDVRGLETTLNVANAAAASDVPSVLRELRERARSELRDAALADIVGDIRVRRDGATVTTSVSRTVDELQSLVDGN